MMRANNVLGFCLFFFFYLLLLHLAQQNVLMETLINKSLGLSLLSHCKTMGLGIDLSHYQTIPNTCMPLTVTYKNKSDRA